MGMSASLQRDCSECCPLYDRGVEVDGDAGLVADFPCPRWACKSFNLASLWHLFHSPLRPSCRAPVFAFSTPADRGRGLARPRAASLFDPQLPIKGELSQMAKH